MQPANMTGLAQPPPSRRLGHQDPPRLWRNIIAGSVGMHLLLLLALPSLLQTVDSQSQAGMQAPTAVELIDLAQVGVNSQAGAGEGAGAIDMPNPEAPNSEAPNPELPAENVPAAAQSTQTAPPSAFAPTALAGDRPLPPSPTSSPFPPPSPDPQPPPDTANPVEPTTSPDTTSPDTASPENSSPDSASPDNLPAAENPGLPPRAVGEPLPDAPNPYPGNVAREDPSSGGGLAGGGNPDAAGAGNPDADGNIPGAGSSEISINSQPMPTSLTGVVSIGQLPPSETADTPDQSAVLLSDSFTVIADPTQPGACELTPESVNFFGATVAMRVTVEQDGRVSETQILQSSGSTEYTELASCLVKQNLEFTPASMAGIAIASSNLVVSITVVGS
jgi:outer membrane biosynthesis protein TonB